MLGNFEYHNPTKLYFGKDALSYLSGELAKQGKSVALVYGGGSIKKNGIYDKIMDILKKAGKEVTEISGVMSNPTSEKLAEGVEIARKGHVDFILAVGGGSPAATTPRPFPFPLITAATPGKNISLKWKNRTAKSCL